MDDDDFGGFEVCTAIYLFLLYHVSVGLKWSAIFENVMFLSLAFMIFRSS